MSSKTRNSGFTLIELLVVIAIIGILSAVVLASLNTARSKGSDAAIKSNVNNARAAAELYYDSNSNSYAGVCAQTNTNGINNMKVGAENAGSGDVPVSSTHLTLPTILRVYITVVATCITKTHNTTYI